MEFIRDRYITPFLHRRKVGLWIIRLMFLLGFITLISLVWAVIEVIQAPYDGLVLDAWSGHVEFVDPSGPTANQVLVGDLVREVELKVMEGSISLYEEKVIGDEVVLTIDRTGELNSVKFLLTKLPTTVLISYLIPIFIGSLFFLVSLTIFSFKPWDFAIKLFYLTSQIGALCLVIGQITILLRPGFDRPFLTLLVIVGPLSLHFHVKLLRIRSYYLYKLIQLSYLLSSSVVIIYIINWGNIISLNNQFIYYRAAPILLILNWLLIIVILFLAYYRYNDISMKGVIRLVSIGGLFGLFPIIVFSLIPYYVGRTPILPIPSGLFLLGIIPFTYGYAILRHRLIQVEDRLSRPAAQMLVLAFVFGIYFLMITLMRSIVGLNFQEEPVTFTIFVMLSSGFFSPLRKFFYKLINYMIYGGSYDYRSMVMTSAQEISNSKDMNRLSDQIINIFKMMHFPAGIIFRISSGNLINIVEYGDEKHKVYRLALDGEIARSLRINNSIIWLEDLYNSINSSMLTADERALLAITKFRLWVPLKPRAELRGLLLLSSGFGKESMTTEDADILETLGSLIAIAMENVELLDALQEKIKRLEIAQAEVSESRRRLAVGRETERIHLARELHDTSIQDLHAIRIRLGGIATGHVFEEIQAISNQVLSVIYGLRDLCANLRPPSLAHFGLKAAMKSLVENYEASNYMTNYWLDAQFNGFQHTELSELTIFRILQEGLNNVSHHAHASNVWVRYSEDDRDINLEIIDDGGGFSVPETFLEFARDGHLGLLGIAERVESIGGALKVESNPGSGSTISINAAQKEILKRVESSHETTSREDIGWEKFE